MESVYSLSIFRVLVFITWYNNYLLTFPLQQSTFIVKSVNNYDITRQILVSNVLAFFFLCQVLVQILFLQ